MKRLERTLEKKCVTWARAQGFLVLKLTPAGQRGYPDRVFVVEGGKVCFVEFKRGCEKLTPIQKHRRSELRSLGCEVFVARDFGTFVRQVRQVCGA